MKDVFRSQDGQNIATGIGSVQSSTVDAGIHYSVSGQVVPASQKGVQIIRMKDGSVRKIIK